MTCPKCEEGNVQKIKFKNTGKKAFLCDFCQALWFDGENITNNTTHTMRSFSQGENMEYNVEYSDDKDQEHQALI